MKTTTTDRQDFQRALDMERTLLSAAVQRVEPHPLGLLLFDDRRPRVWVHNQLDVTGPAGDIDDLVRVLDDRYGHLDHRRAVIEDEVEGRRLAAGFRDRGWQVETHVYMALREPPDHEPDERLAAEVGAAEHEAIERRTMAESSFATDDDVLEQMMRAREAERRGADAVHWIGGFAGGEPAGHTIVYKAGELAQVEHVVTLSALRGRGVARAMVSLATHLTAEADLVWLAADDDDWPKELYVKLGFRPIGRTVVLTRLPQG
jgi:predicted GNAT family acetyltransferase